LMSILTKIPLKDWLICFHLLFQHIPDCRTINDPRLILLHVMAGHRNYDAQPYNNRDQGLFLYFSRLHAQ
jgi:hypothetical protein